MSKFIQYLLVGGAGHGCFTPPLDSRITSYTFLPPPNPACNLFMGSVETITPVVTDASCEYRKRQVFHRQFGRRTVLAQIDLTDAQIIELIEESI